MEMVNTYSFYEWNFLQSIAQLVVIMLHTDTNDIVAVLFSLACYPSRL